MRQQFIAALLIVSLFLQSCGGISNSLVPSEKKRTDNFRRLSKKVDIEQLVDQELTAGGGYVVNFYENEGALKADVKVDEFQKDPTYINLPVIQGHLT